jgi:hypothetical protein
MSELPLNPVRLLAGVGLYFSLALLHQSVIGVSPLPSF